MHITFIILKQLCILSVYQDIIKINFNLFAIDFNILNWNQFKSI